MSLMEQFANPNAMHSLSMTEKLAGAGITTLMGMGITFVILLLLWGCIGLMNKITGVAERREQRGAESKEASPEPVVIAKQETSPDIDRDYDVTAVVIAAAIAANEADTVGFSSNLVVRKIRRVSGTTTAWDGAGRVECIESRKF